MLTGIILISWLCSLPGISGEIWMDTTPIKQRVKAGNTVVLGCTVENLEGRMVMWFGPGNDMLFNGDSAVTPDRRFSLTHPYPSSWNLVIKNVKIGDAGEYRCQIGYPSTLTKRITLEVQVSPRIFPSQSSGDQRVKEGSDFNIMCVATGYPLPRIMWHLVRGDRKTQEGTGPQLNISNVGRQQGGIYRCTAFNGVTPSATRDIKVDVEYAPAITVNTQTLSQERGKRAVLECSVEGFPQGTFYWIKDDRVLERNWNYEPQNIQQNSTSVVMNLLIKQAESPSGFGVYYCVAENELGRATGNVTLHEITTTTTTTTIAPTTAASTVASTTASKSSSTMQSAKPLISSTQSTSSQRPDISTTHSKHPTTPHISTVTPRRTSYRPAVTSGPGYEINSGDQANSSARVTSHCRAISILVVSIFFLV